MPTVRNAELLNRLNNQIAQALRTADQNRSGVLTLREERNLDPAVRTIVRSYRTNANGRVDVDLFLSAFQQYAASSVANADANHDGFLTAAEQGSLPPQLRAVANALLGTAPSAPATPANPNPPAPIPGIGPFGISGVIPAARVVLHTILSQQLNQPTGLAFNPRDGSLWIVNRGNDSSVIVDSPGQPNQHARRFFDDSDHFMNNPMAIAFSRTRNEFATVQDTENDYNGHAHHGNMFMGPTLWTADRRDYEGGANSHLDMLHHSPRAVGIAAGAAPRGVDQREYWVFNGQAGSIDRYFFNEPHEPGGDDHHDGLTYRYADGQLQGVAGVPGHLALDTTGGGLYIADTGNGRIARLNTRASIANAELIPAFHDETPLYGAPGAQITSVTGPNAGLVHPSGLILKGADLIVADHGTGHIKVFGTDGTLKGDVDTGLGPGSLTGLAESPNGQLYFLDAQRNQVVRLEIA